MTRLILASLLLTLAACGGGSVADMKADAEVALAAGDFATAQSSAEAALEKERAADADKVTIWNLQNTCLAAMTRSGDAFGAISLLDDMGSEYPDQVDAKLYVKAASEVKSAGNLLHALEVLKEGEQRYPEGTDLFAPLLAEFTAAAENDDELLARLKELGYIGN